MNYSNILIKCVNELDAKEPRLDYLKGMLEVLLEMSDKPITYETKISTNKQNVPYIPADEPREDIPPFLRVA